MAQSDKRTTLLDDKRFLNKLDSLVARSHARTDAFLNLNNDAIRYIYGHQIFKQRQEGWDYPVVNQLFSDVMQEVAMLSANNPKLQAVAVEDSDLDAAKTCGEVIQSYWVNQLNMQIQIMQALLDAKTSGIYVFKWWWEQNKYWDAAANQGRGAWEGDLMLRTINPNFFGCDPDVELAAHIPTDAKFVVIEHHIDMEEAAWRWPIYANYLKAKNVRDAGDSLWIPGGGDHSTDETGANVSAAVASDSWSGRERTELTVEAMQRRLADMLIGTNASGASGGETENSTTVRVQEIYWRDRTTEHVPAEMEDYPALQPGEQLGNIFKPPGDIFHYDKDKPITDKAGQIVGYDRFKGQWPQRQAFEAFDRPKYPNGRLTIRVGDDCIVEDTALPYSRWPVAVGVNYLLPHVWNGLNSVELAREMQDYLNNISCHFLNNTKHFSDPMWIVEDDTLMAKGKRKNAKLSIPNAAGKVLSVVRGGLNRLKREEPAEIPQSQFMLYDLFKNAKQDINGVHDVAQGRANSSDNTLGELQMLNRNTRLRIGMQGSILDATLRQVGQGMAEILQTHLPVNRWLRVVGDGPKQAQASMQWTQQLKETKYDIVIETASTLPYDEEREIVKYKEAFGVAGPVMLEAYLKKLGIPNVEEIMAKHPIMGPLEMLLDMAQQAGKGPQEVLMAVQQMLMIVEQAQNEEGSQSNGQQSQPSGGPAAAPAAG